MADKTVAVRLLAMTGQYRAAMAGATRSSATFAAKTAAGNAGVSSSLGMGKAGIAGAALLAVGAVTKLSYDYGNAFTKIGAITNASSAQVAQWRERVLSLAGETAQAPQDLAEGLYFLASAGLDTADVMPALEASAKGAAVGLGEMGDVTRIVANVMNAYPEAGLKATDVIDKLVAGIREGTAEPEEFADALGRILPVAAKAGVSVDQLIASLASLSNIGLDVNEGVTAMRGLLNATVSPGKQAAEALASIGLSADDLRRSLAEDGLIATLRLLEDRTGGNMDLMKKIVPNIRAMTGAFGLTGQEAEKVDEIFRQVADSTGDLGESFGKTADSDGFKLRQALSELAAVGIQLGDDVLPIVVGALQVLAQGAHNAMVKIEGLWNAYMSFVNWLSHEETLTTVIDIDQWIEALQNGDMALEASRKQLLKYKQAGELTGFEIAHLEFAQDMLESKLITMALAAKQGDGAITSYASSAREAGDAASGHAAAQDRANRELREGAGLADRLTTELEILAGVQLRAADAAIGWEQAIDDAFAELKDGAKTLDLTTQAGRDNAQSINDAAQAAIEHGASVAEETGSLNKGVKAVQSHMRSLIEEATRAGISERAVRNYIRQLNLTPKQIATLIEAKTEAASTKLERYRAKLWALNGMSVTTYVNTALTESREGGPQPKDVGHAGGMIGALGARRMHGGGDFGDLRGDEGLFIGQRGERLLSAREWSSFRAIAGGGANSVSSGSSSRGRGGREHISVGIRLDRRRFTREYDHDAEYSGYLS